MLISPRSTGELRYFALFGLVRTKMPAATTTNEASTITIVLRRELF
jgi:hypothetical protein